MEWQRRARTGGGRRTAALNGLLTVVKLKEWLPDVALPYGCDGGGKFQNFAAEFRMQAWNSCHGFAAE
jgi:hypothetical protein